VKYYVRGAALVIAGLITSAGTYPMAVRIARKVFGLRDFLNIHMVDVI
jgi:hypothetical protein